MRYSWLNWVLASKWFYDDIYRTPIINGFRTTKDTNSRPRRWPALVNQSTTWEYVGHLQSRWVQLSTEVHKWTTYLNMCHWSDPCDGKIYPAQESSMYTERTWIQDLSSKKIKRKKLCGEKLSGFKKNENCKGILVDCCESTNDKSHSFFFIVAPHFNRSKRDETRRGEMRRALTIVACSSRKWWEEQLMSVCLLSLASPSLASRDATIASKQELTSTCAYQVALRNERSPSPFR